MVSVELVVLRNIEFFAYVELFADDAVGAEIVLRVKLACGAEPVKDPVNEDALNIVLEGRCNCAILGLNLSLVFVLTTSEIEEGLSESTNVK